MTHFLARLSALTMPFVLLTAVAVVAAVMLKSPAIAATAGQCSLPKAVAVDRTVAQSGKARTVEAGPLIARPAIALREHLHPARETALASPVSYVRCDMP